MIFSFFIFDSDILFYISYLEITEKVKYSSFIHSFSHMLQTVYVYKTDYIIVYAFLSIRY